MKALLKLTLILTLFSSLQSSAQSTIYFESFDGTTIKGNSYTIGLSSNFSWDTTSIVSISKSNSYHADIHNESSQTGLPGTDTLVFETDTFNTVGYNHLLFEFDHIAAIRPFESATIQFSDDGGVTWQDFNVSAYYGTDVLFSSLEIYNEASYANLGSPWSVVKDTFPPTDTLWQHEVFDISSLAPNTTNAKVRFIIYASVNAVPSSGWYIDNISISGSSTCELIRPIIIHSKPNISIYTNTDITIDARVSDNIAVDSVNISYKINSGSFNTVQMPNLGSFNYQFIIPEVQLKHNDTVSYFITAYDTCINTNTFPVATSWNAIYIDSLTISINESQLLNSFEVYPNPTNDKVYIDIENHSESLNITVVNTLGQIVYEESSLKKGDGQIYIDTEKFESGIYYLSIEYDGKYITEKLIIE